MGTCRFSLDEVTILNHRSDSDHSDNDWVTWFWWVDDVALPARTAPLRTDDGSAVLWDGAVIHGLADEVTCRDTDWVALLWVIVNMSSIDAPAQQAAVDQLSARVSAGVQPDYAALAAQALGYVTAGPLGPALQGTVDAFTGAIDGALTKAVGDAITGVLAGIASIVEGQPDCNGEIARGAWNFASGQAFRMTETTQIEGPRGGDACGLPPHTKVSITATREVTDVTTDHPGDATAHISVAHDRRLAPHPSSPDASTTTAPDNPELGRFRRPGLGRGLPGQPRPVGPGEPGQRHT